MRNSGFKVYEMIVVLAILMVLAGLLMPVLRKTRLDTIRNVCASNLRQLHQAVLLYEQEHGKDTLPPYKLSLQHGLRPYLGDTFLSCPLAPPRETKPWVGFPTPEEQSYEYGVCGGWAGHEIFPGELLCRKRVGDRIPLVCDRNHLKLLKPGYMIFIRRNGQLSIMDEQTINDRWQRAFRIRQSGGQDPDIPCPQWPTSVYNL